MFKLRGARQLIAIGVATITPFLLAGAASASGGPNHDGPPRSWGPALAQLCEDGPAAAAAAGYFVIVGDAQPNVITGTASADAIFSLGGNDTVRGGLGGDLLCLGQGNDRGRGNEGNDGIFGEEHNDELKGDKGRDYLNGGTQIDDCDGGPASDAQDFCDTVVSVP